MSKRWVSFCKIHKHVAACILWPNRCVLVEAKLPPKMADVVVECSGPGTLCGVHGTRHR